MLAKKTASHEEEKFHISSETMNYDERTKVLNHSDSFGIFDRWGDIHPYTKKAHGIFHKGTRFISRLELRINEKRPLLLSSSIKEENDILSVDTANPDLEDCNLSENTVHIYRSQFLRNGVYYEEIGVENFSEAKCSFEISLAFGADFKDLFEIRGTARTLQPNKPQCTSEDNKILFDYEGLDHIHRQTEILFPNQKSLSIQNHQATIDFQLAPHQHKKIDYLIVFHTEEIFLSDKDDGDKKVQTNIKEAKQQLKTEFRSIQNLFAGISTSNDQFNHWLTRSKADLVSLITKTPTGLYPYAGVPWYNTAFGRDGIITSMEILWLAPDVAKNALLFLAKMQATENDPHNDAEPGKILHEARSGEMANTGEIPFKRYYGTIDATPLYIMLAGMYYERTNDLSTIKKIWPNIKAALNWIDKYGDLDGDGFIEYQHKAENGLTNQGWKDSFDSIMYADGKLCQPPIALCEVQGYVYAAKHYASEMAKAFDEQELSQKLNDEAISLKEKFNKAFWIESLGCYALALDGNKKPCEVVASNAGQCLFTGIVDEKHAAVLAETITNEDMFSGWGVRTLSSKEVRYNPMSYHDGSIWPHDNALIAFGLSKYGFYKEAMRIMSALYDAALFIEMQRLPELYCGFERRLNEGPTAYPVACSPQAWSVASVFLLLQSCLRIQIIAKEKTIIFNRPVMPRYLNTLTITGLKVKDSTFDIEMFRHEEDAIVKVIHKEEEWKIIVKQ